MRIVQRQNFVKNKLGHAKKRSNSWKESQRSREIQWVVAKFARTRIWPEMEVLHCCIVSLFPKAYTACLRDLKALENKKRNSVFNQKHGITCLQKHIRNKPGGERSTSTSVALPKWKFAESSSTGFQKVDWTTHSMILTPLSRCWFSQRKKWQLPKSTHNTRGSQTKRRIFRKYGV